MSTITEEATEVAVVVSGAELSRVLKNVLPHAGKDDTLPILTAVQVTYADGQLQVRATDRYTAARDYVTVSEDDRPADGSSWAFNLSGKDATHVARTFAKSLYVTVTHSGDDLTFTDLSSRLSFRSVGGTFPQIDAIINGARDRDPGGIPRLAFDPAKLARFAKTSAGGYRKAYEVMVFHFPTEQKVVYVKIGETFDGVIMPVRISD